VITDVGKARRALDAATGSNLATRALSCATERAMAEQGGCDFIASRNLRGRSPGRISLALRVYVAAGMSPEASPNRGRGLVAKTSCSGGRFLE